MIKKLPVIAVSLLLTHPAYASDYYVGLNLGVSDQSTKFTLLDSSVDPTVNINYQKDYQAPEDSTAAYGVFFGYRLGRDVALEFGHVKIQLLEGELRPLNDGGVIDPDTSLPTDYLAAEDVDSNFNYLALVGAWPMGNNWSVHAKIGVSTWSLNYSQTVEDNSVPVNDPGRLVRVESYSDTSSALFYGLGMSYGFSESIEIRLAYDLHKVDMSFTNVDVEHKVGLASLAAAWHF